MAIYPEIWSTVASEPGVIGLLAGDGPGDGPGDGAGDGEPPPIV